MTAYLVTCIDGLAHAEALLIEAEGFEFAAISFAETWSAAGEACRLSVEHPESGERRCFAIEIGAAAG